MKKVLTLMVLMMIGIDFTEGVKKESWRLHTLFSVESQNYFDMKVKQPGPVTRLLSCTDEKKKNYKGMHLAPIFEVPSVSRHPKTGDWYPSNKPPDPGLGMQSHLVSTPVVSNHMSPANATATPVVNVPVTTVEIS